MRVTRVVKLIKLSQVIRRLDAAFTSDLDQGFGVDYVARRRLEYIIELTAALAGDQRLVARGESSVPIGFVLDILRDAGCFKGQRPATNAQKWQTFVMCVQDDTRRTGSQNMNVFPYRIGSSTDRLFNSRMYRCLSEMLAR